MLLAKNGSNIPYNLLHAASITNFTNNTVAMIFASIKKIP